MALDSSRSDNWGGGIYRGRNAPPNSIYDGVNALINDEGYLFKRGGSAYLSTSNAGSTLLRVVAPYFVGPGATRPLAWSSSDLYTVDGSNAPVNLKTSLASPLLSRPALVGGYAAFPWVSGGIPALVYYAGSRKSANYSTGTYTVAAGGTTLTGSGTSWLANVDAGMIFTGSDGTHAIVAAVNSDTSITLTAPWAGAVAAGAAYSLNRTLTTTFSALPTPTNTTMRAVSGGSVQPRLLWVINNRAYMSPAGNPFSFDISTYHELPLGAEITGAMPTGDSVALFSSSGIWRIDNLSLDPVDDFGNVQQQVGQISNDVILWGDSGLAAYAGSFVVPALDDVYLVSPDGQAAVVSESIRSLYRSYVKAGYQPGLSAAHRGHYFLTILDAAGTSVIDALVCRLDRPFQSAGRTFWPWTRWSGYAAGLGVASAVGGGVAPKLLGINGQRITDLSSTLDPSSSNAQDADGTNFDCTITTRDFATSPGSQPGFVQRARARYVLTDDGSGATAAPTVAIAYSSDQDADAYTTLTEKGEQGGAAGWGTSDGSKYQWALVAKRRDRIRLKITQTGAAASFILRSLELLIRPQGKQ